MKYSTRQILIIIFILIAIIGSIFITGISYTFYKFNISHVISHNASILSIISDIIGGPFWTLQGTPYPGTIENILRETLKMSDVVFMRIVDLKSGEIEKSGELNEVSSKINNLPPFEQEVSIRDGFFNNGPIKEFSIKSKNGTNLWMGITLENIKEHVFSIAIMIGEIIAIFSIIIIISIFLLVKKIILNPLIILADSFAKMKNKKYEKIGIKEIPPVKEIKNVFESFNIMNERINETENRLEEELRKTREIDRQKSEFISIAAHQLRTPLTAVKWTLQMIINGDLGELTSEQKAFLSQSYQGNERTIKLVNDFLNVSRIEEGRLSYVFELIHLEDLMNNLIQDFEHIIKEKQIDFVFEKPKEPLPKVKIDHSKMRLAIQNLIDNAIKYTQEKGKVAISIKNSIIHLEVAIKDTGYGIPKGQYDRIFTKFFRGENIIKRQVEGTGLGLFIVKNIIEKHGGTVWFESEENKGTTFYFTIPVST